ncbi:hypothetical protein GDO86_012658 [Hymenochirus boettgeri]|uniref:Uncharacterized protein n=1 Tax=Hymenochirus boettgeri TaxID=247094 RepID=A0A8T2ITF5_9PIPI|nr:hypothetical protein GDO86_012658 [Hymenochirus boettgeri]
MAQREDGVFVLQGRKAALSEKPHEFLSNTQKTTNSHNLTFQGPASTRRLGSRNEQVLHKHRLSSTVSQYSKENPSIVDLEDSLRKLKVQVNSLASSLNWDNEKATKSYNYSDGDKAQWPIHVNGTFSDTCSGGSIKASQDIDWFLKPEHSMESSISGNNSMYSVSPFTFGENCPVKLGAPHVIGVKSLLPPKIPVHSRPPGTSVVRGRSQSLERSHSFSPVAKKARCLRSRSQSPKPVWRPNSAKTNAYNQPAPRLRYSGKTSSSNRQSRSQLFRSGSLVARSFIPPRKPKSTWSPYSLSSSSISSPSAEEISERFMQTLTGGDARRSVFEASAYQQELARLRLEKLKVEEEFLIEIKRQQELERTRGPKPKWYEMKNSQFHYEAHKNNELLRNNKEHQTIFDYRQELSTASQKFQQNQKIAHLDLE